MGDIAHQPVTVPWSQLRTLYVVVVGTAIVGTLMWMSSIGMVTAPNFFFSSRNDYDAPYFDQAISKLSFLTNSSRVVDADFTAENAVPDTGRSNFGELHSRLSIEEKLALVNVLGPDSFDFGRSFYLPNDIINLTIGRLDLRVQARLSDASLYQSRLNESVYQTDKPYRKYVSHVIIDGGLGNWMFMVGSLFGVSRVNFRIPTLLKDYWAEKAFENFSIEKQNRSVLLGNDSQEIWDRSVIGELGPGKFTPQMTRIADMVGDRNVLLAGYLQSWRYFDLFRDEVRSLFTFSKTVFTASVTAIEKAIRTFMNSSIAADQVQSLPTLVGIHVRRGDIVTSPDQAKHGHRPASEEYLLRVALHFQRTHAPVLFIVISNDISYCKNLYKEPNFLFMENNPEAVDIAVLSLMDHIILSVGTYGWWGAYLSDAREIYYFKDWPRNGSDMERIFNKEEYFLPSWTPFE